jgi:hypothetical protein
MVDKIRRIRCGTKKCTGFIDTKLSAQPKSADGHWQFHCTLCKYWTLAVEDGSVRATSREQFDLDRSSNHTRLSNGVRREPPGGV